MKIVVCVKQVVLLPGALVLLSDGSEADPLFTRRLLNDPDRYAVEEALRICEAFGDGEVVVVTVGPDAACKALRKCLAMGAHRATRVASAELELSDPLTVARALAQVIREEAADLVLCGVQSEDAAQQATAPALGSALGQPCVTLATAIEVAPDKASVTINREASGGDTEVVEVQLPAVITVQTGINTPRTENFKAVMMANKAPVAVAEPEAIPKSHIRVLGISPNPPARGDLELVDGGPAEVAARIKALVREAL